jgi:plastocyanin
MRRRRLQVLVPLLAILAATVPAAAPAEAGGGCHAPATEARGTTVALTDLCFTPTVLRVAPGTEVTFVNRDTITHPLSRPGGDWYWDGAGGTRSTVRLDEAGTYPFFCHAHPGMVGVVVVGDGQGLGASVTGVAAPAPAADDAAADALAADALAAPDAAAAGTGKPAGATAQSAGLPRFPATWLVLVALAGLVGVVAGTRLSGRPRSGAGGPRPEARIGPTPEPHSPLAGPPNGRVAQRGKGRRGLSTHPPAR